MGPRKQWDFETFAMRGLAVVALALALFPFHSALTRHDESALRRIARGALGATLAYAAWRAWRRPDPVRRALGLRRRVIRLVAVLASPQLLREFAESSPSVPVGDALASDFRRALGTRPAGLAEAFGAEEREGLAVIERALGEPDLDHSLDTSRLLEDPAWSALRTRAQALIASLAKGDAPASSRRG